MLPLNDEWLDITLTRVESEKQAMIKQNFKKNKVLTGKGALPSQGPLRDFITNFIGPIRYPNRFGKFESNPTD